MGIILELKETKEYRFLSDVKDAQMKRFLNAGFNTEEAQEWWEGGKDTYLFHWREFVDHNLVKLPLDLSTLSANIINRIAEKL